jgi:DNA-binding response OmpR family regulator
MTDSNAQPIEPYDPSADEDFDNDDMTVAHIPRILIVEDTVELAEILQATLTKLHMMTYRETHGTRALERYHSVRPDVVLLDIGLPDMTGWRVLDAIKEQKTVYNRPAIIVMTAYGDPANRLMGKLQGVDDYLIKPFTPDDIKVVVQRVLQQQSDADRDKDKKTT